MSNLRDVARHANVSLGTASAVYTGSRGVSTAARGKVLTAAAALGYEARPRSAARAGSVVLISHCESLNASRAHEHDGDIVQGILDACEGTHRHITYVQITGENAAGLLVRERSRARRAFLFLNVAPAWTREALHHRRAGQVPVILGDRGLAHRYDSVVSDDVSSMQSIATRLVSEGEQHFILLRGPQEYTAFRDRYTTATATLAQLLRGPHTLRSVDCRDGFEAGAAAASAVLGSCGTGHATILAAHDMQALGLLSKLRQLGVSVPRDLSVMGWDDILPARACAPPLTTVHVPRNLLGRVAAHLVSDRLLHTDGDAHAPVTLTVTCSFAERGSTRPRARAPRRAASFQATPPPSSRPTLPRKKG